MTTLDELEDRAVYILREAYKHFTRPCMLWSIGKDSTVLLWLARKAFFGHCPFPLVHINTTFKIPEMIVWRDRLAADWGLRMVEARNEKALADGMHPDRGKIVCCTALKTEAFRSLVDAHSFDGVVVGVRADEEGTRAKERHFSPRTADNDWDFRSQPPEFWDQYKTRFPAGIHVRIHPLLDWTEINVWEYIEREKVPVIPLYFDQGDGRRYRSLGCGPCTGTIGSTAKNPTEVLAELRATRVAERAGRAQDADRGMEKLRRDGYM